ncbi:MAG: SAM-dependent chlorinase/fluorinase [Schleiferiaceae bacterium]|nr:SAM-dependent chlorinase/fluorinase [Schleiferiaceae bacterium]
MPLVTLTSDYGWNDPDTAVVRGHVYGEMLRSKIAAPLVDLSHGIPPRDHMEAGYVIRSAYPHFPKGSIHLVLVDSMDLSIGQPMAMELDGHYFLGLNHGGLSLIRPDLKPSQMVQLDLKNRLELQDVESLLAAAAAHLLNRGALSMLGPSLSDWRSLHPPHPEVKNPETAIVHVQYIDHFGQLVTNASREWLQSWHGSHPFVTIARGRRVTRHISSASQIQEAGELYTRINRYGYLELGVSQPGAHGINTAASLLGIQIHDPIELQRK